tara:strand:+ start:1705 stop:2103 length:399 start_codon:yes stop_codon:yes gene_type:complete
MTKIFKKDYYEKLMRKRGSIDATDLWKSSNRMSDEETKTRSAYVLKELNMETLAAILTYKKDNNGKLPSRRELAKLLPKENGEAGSYGKVSNRLDNLFKAGLIDYDDDNSEIIVDDLLIKSLLQGERNDAAQ